MPTAPTHTALERERLIESFAPLADKLAWRYRHWSLDHDDMAQLAMIAVVHAIDEFDADREMKLANWVWTRIEWELLKVIGDANRTTRTGPPLPPELPDRSSDCDDDDQTLDLWDAIDDLPARDRSILISSYGLGGQAPRSSITVGRGAGISKRSVNRFNERSLKRLRRALSA